MTSTIGNFMGLDSHEPRDRLAVFLDRQYRGEHKTKRLAADITCSPKTAENILNGHWPNSRHMAAIVRRFGRDVVDAMFAPEIDDTVARLTEELRDLEDRLEETRRRARQARGAADRLAEIRDRHEDGAARLTRSHDERADG